MKHTSKIQRFLDGDMNENELKKFREEMQTDPGLIQELDLHRSIDETIISKDEERFRKKLEEAYKTYKIKSESLQVTNITRKKSKMLRNVLITVPVLIFLLGAIFYQGFRKESNDSIFDSYFVAYNKDLSSRDLPSNGSKSGNLERAVKLYLQDQYAEASQLFSAIIYEDPGNSDARFYNGLCFIYLNDLESAMRSFDFVRNQPYNYYQEYAGWYLAMCYIKTNNIAGAKNLLRDINEGNGFFSSRAKKVLRKLK